MFVLLAVLLATCSAAVAAAGAASAAPGGYYVSLGDSLAFGYQPNLVAAGDLNATDYRSYAEDYTALHPGLRLVNFGCPGETSGTLLAGGCPWLALPTATLHNSYGAAGSQYGAAVAFLQAHPGQVNLISVDIGSNDLLGLIDSCKTASNLLQCVTAGLPGTLGTLATNYGQLVGTLRALAPTAQIVLFNFYNPLALSIPGSDQLAQAASTVVDQIAAHFGASVANAFGVINVDPGTPVEHASICLLTWECTSYANIHPDTLGYWALTAALWQAVSG